MGTAYTPGLTVSASRIIQRVRRLPIKGQTLVEVGEQVCPDTIVARAYLPGIMQSVRVANMLGIDPSDLAGALQVKVGDVVDAGATLAESKGLFGLFRSEAKSPAAGTVEIVSDVTGNVGIRLPATPIDVTAYISGEVAEILPGEGVVVEAHAALIQGIFGVGPERTGIVTMVSSGPDRQLDAADISDDMAGKILVGGSGLTGAALARASEVGATGVIVGAIVDLDLIGFLGYDIGVAITGHEKIGTTLVITEGFGIIPMASRTFDLLRSLDGRIGSINGATQIRAGVIRPELIVPHTTRDTQGLEDTGAFELAVGSSIRIIREPYFGALATVTALPAALVTVDSGAGVRVLNAALAGGRTVTVPRANVEIVAG